MPNPSGMTPTLTELHVHTERGALGYPFAIILGSGLPEALDIPRALARRLGTEVGFLTPLSAGGLSGDDEAARFAARWFSEHGPIQLCGAGALAAAGLLLQREGTAPAGGVVFETPAARLVAQAEEDRVWVRLPARALTEHAPAADLLAALGSPVPVRCVLAPEAATVILALPSHAAVEALRPDFARLKRFDEKHLGAVIATAPGEGYDYVFRYFAPWHGADESLFAGSAHSTLAPFWAGRIGRSSLSARQLAGSGTPFRVRVEKGGVWIGAQSRVVRRCPLADALL